jgi:3-isopropylmalate/(R)-2-methylmalate dehydratase small subunit
MGLTITEKILAAHCGQKAVEPGEFIRARVDIAAGLITDVTTGAAFRAAPFPAFLQEMIALGGLIPYTRRRLGLG